MDGRKLVAWSCAPQPGQMRLFFKPPCLYRELHSGHLMTSLTRQAGAAVKRSRRGAPLQPWLVNWPAPLDDTLRQQVSLRQYSWRSDQKERMVHYWGQLPWSPPCHRNRKGDHGVCRKNRLRRVPALLPAIATFRCLFARGRGACTYLEEPGPPPSFRCELIDKS